MPSAHSPAEYTGSAPLTSATCSTTSLTYSKKLDYGLLETCLLSALFFHCSIFLSAHHSAKIYDLHQMVHVPILSGKSIQFHYEKINNGATRCSGGSRIFKKEVSGFKTKKNSAQIRPSKVD